MAGAEGLLERLRDRRAATRHCICRLVTHRITRGSAGGSRMIAASHAAQVLDARLDHLRA